MKKNLPENHDRTIQRAFNRTLDFNPVVKSVAPTNESGIKGVRNAHIYVSAGVPQYCVQIDGTYWRLSMTSAF